MTAPAKRAVEERGKRRRGRLGEKNKKRKKLRV